MTCKKCGMTLNAATNKCYTCGNDDQSGNVEPPTDRINRTLIILRSVAVAFSIITIIVSLIILFRTEPSGGTLYILPSYKIFACITLIVAIFNFLTAVFISKLKIWAVHLYVAFTVINCAVSLTVFTVTRFQSGEALDLSVIFKI